MDHIKVSDKYGKYNNWNIENDMGNYYEVFCGNFITVLSKDRIREFEGNMISSEIRHFHDCEDAGGSSVGNEECSVCGRKIHSLSRLVVVEDTDKYMCKKCAKKLNIRVKSARNLQ
jgi:predicted RNA-binding Zn-ribbon protein involved in translation (DUF1610 family)